MWKGNEAFLGPLAGISRPFGRPSARNFCRGPFEHFLVAHAVRQLRSEKTRTFVLKTGFLTFAPAISVHSPALTKGLQANEMSILPPEWMPNKPGARFRLLDKGARPLLLSPSVLLSLIRSSATRIHNGIITFNLAYSE